MENTFTKVMNHEGNLRFTENGAAAYATTNNPLLDCNFAVTNWRFSDEDEIISMFSQAYNADPIMAITWAFFLRDCRGGLGERRSFRIILEWLLNNHSDNLEKVLNYIPEYGRWDDLIEIAILGNKKAQDIIKAQFAEDLADIVLSEKPISLLGKWLPSCNTSSKETRAKGRKIAKALKMSEASYRKALSCLRKRIDIVETRMSSNDWTSINYESVPAKAALNYANAFLKHDEERRLAYIEQVMLGNAKATMGGLNPYEIWHKCISEHDKPTEKLYNSVWDRFVLDGFPDTEAFNDCICIIDTSGSMSSMINNSVSNRDIAYSLGKYFSSRAKGPFKNKCITFSERPEWIDLSNCLTPWEANTKFNKTDWGFNTDIKAVFDMILNAVKEFDVDPDDIPKSLLIVSDMQFDSCVDGCETEQHTIKLFDDIASKWHEAEYKLPKLIFWSIDNGGIYRREGITVPQIDCGDNGVTLISGYSQNTAKAAMSEKKDPSEALYEVLYSERYDAIRKALS